MIISRYGVDLVRVQKEDIEMIRIWRNDPKIRDHMFFKSDISPEMQREWFNSIHNDQNFYFMVCPDQQPIGLISLSSVDFENNKAFAGLFIYDDNYMGTDVPVRASLCMLDVFFAYTSIDTVFAKVLNSNTVADQYNTSLGFEKTKKIELGKGYEYSLGKKRYFEKARTLREAAIKLYGSKSTIRFANELLEINLKNKFIEMLDSASKGEFVTVIDNIEIL